ncbi:MAG: putative O-glycosylation ligase, exosortase A system-associated [Zoogloea oleivorans]|uniref:Putative O-glycosylation ligase, exosortase A system-associated n=1 Tax=Zoogloea oleivorans TaxID=1552750 RepID=A0A6C2CZ05_9RHOO|nr:putative O-glycosylation ligase, exosortase A system-associated [Zoogloea oleivorans]MDY0034794.1 putative O-glycosylation ligase, exosortase A system-associated [Zoogloea oleivorans]TYC58773.1 putative O-glycosylation ligase, exosortase A system-associated [Zoogloea oleivorans]
MRDLLLIVILLGTLPFAFKHTYVAVLLWTWVSIMNPHKLAYGFANDAPFALVAAVTALVSLIATKDKLKLPKETPVTVLILFVIWMAITTAASFYPDESFMQLKKVIKIQLMTLVALAALQERRHIELFIWVNVLSIGFYGLKGGIFTIMTGGSYRVWGPPGGFIEGNNEIAVALIMSIPFMNYLRLIVTHKWVKIGLTAMMVLTAIAALGTQSRGALLALVAMMAVLWVRSDKKMVMGVTLVMVGMLLLALMPSSWEERMHTIKEYEEDGSAMGRINAWWLAFNIANRRITGAGFEAYTPETFAAFAPNPADIHVAHSIYFSVLGEHGYIGLILFLLVWVHTLRVAGKIRTKTRNRKDLEWLFHLAGMSQVALVGYAVGGAFLSLAYFDLPYNIMVIVVVAHRWLLEKSVNSEAQDPGSVAEAGDPAVAVKVRTLPS